MHETSISWLVTASHTLKVNATTCVATTPSPPAASAERSSTYSEGCTSGASRKALSTILMKMIRISVVANALPAVMDRFGNSSTE